MAGKPKDYEATYNDRVVRTDSKADLEYLYIEQRLSTTEIAKIFDNRISNKTIARRLSRFNIMARDNRGKNNPMWTGGKKIGKGGYVLVWRPEHPYCNSQGYVSEHRLVMEAHIGRYLKPTEIVHHKNKNRQDNRIENLQLVISNSAHAKLESGLRRRDELGRFVS